jgi:hypothetical protein
MSLFGPKVVLLLKPLAWLLAGSGGATLGPVWSIDHTGFWKILCIQAYMIQKKIKKIVKIYVFDIINLKITTHT